MQESASHFSITQSDQSHGVTIEGAVSDNGRAVAAIRSRSTTRLRSADADAEDIFRKEGAS